MFGGEVFRREYLALAEAQGPDDLARKHAILYLVRRAFDVSDAEVARGRFDLVDRRRRDDRDEVPIGPMRLEDRAGFGVDLASAMLLVEFLADIGRASCRGRGGQHVMMSVADRSYKQKK